MRFLTCEPNFNKQANYLDEADAFYTNPASWVRSHFPVYPKSALPSHIILFDNLQSKLTDFLVNYKEIHSTFHIDVSTKSLAPWAPIDVSWNGLCTLAFIYKLRQINYFSVLFVIAAPIYHWSGRCQCSHLWTNKRQGNQKHRTGKTYHK